MSDFITAPMNQTQIIQRGAFKHRAIPLIITSANTREVRYVTALRGNTIYDSPLFTFCCIFQLYMYEVMIKERLSTACTKCQARENRINYYFQSQPS